MRGRKHEPSVQQEELAPVIEQAIMRKEKVAPLAEDKISSFVALGRQVAERTAAHAGAGGGAPPHVGRGTNSTRKSGEGLSGGIGCVSLLSSVLAARCEHLPAPGRGLELPTSR